MTCTSCVVGTASRRSYPRSRVRSRSAYSTRGWADRIALTAARSDQPLDGLLVRPDGHVAWAAAAGHRDTDGLHQALQTWFGVAG
jgi:hypothetical protein